MPQSPGIGPFKSASRLTGLASPENKTKPEYREEHHTYEGDIPHHLVRWRRALQEFERQSRGIREENYNCENDEGVAHEIPVFHAETSIAPYRHISSATEDGESSVVDGSNETQQLPAGAGAETPVGKGATGKRSRRGRRRKARSMGRYQFLEASNAYLEFVRPFVAELTAKEGGRKLRMIAKALADRGVSSHPAKWGEREIGAFVAWMKESGFESEYQAKLVQYVRGLLRFVGNPALERMKGARIVRLPSKAEKPVYVKDDSWYAETMGKLEGLSNWGAEAIRFAMAFYYHTGLRVKEVVSGSGTLR